MSKYEYRVIAAPTRGLKAKGIRSAEARFANAIEVVMNEMAADGWEYQRAESLPSSERSGFASTTIKTRNVFIFRRTVSSALESARTLPVLTQDGPPRATGKQADLPEIIAPKTPNDDASKSAGASRMLQDNGVEEVSEVSGLTNSLTQLAASRNDVKTND